MKPRVSVVVPTLRRPHLLARCLAALLRQDLPASAFEIIVVDDGPDVATERVVRRWSASGAASRPGLIVHYRANRGAHGPAAARNVGWRAARAPVVAFTDDDTIPSRSWLAGGLGAIDNGAMAVWGRVRVPLPSHPTDYELDAAGLDSAVFVTANCFVRASALRDVGGFDERFRVAWREDSDLYFRLLKRYRRVDPAPRAVVLHPVRPARFGISISQQRKVIFDALLYRKHPELYRTNIRQQPPYPYYVSVLMLLLAAAAGVLGHSELAWVACAVWFGVTAEFTVRRLRRTSRSVVHVLEMCVTSAVIPIVAVFWRLAGAFRFRVLFV